MLRSTISLGVSAGVLGGLLIAPPAQAADSHIDEAIDALPGIVEQMQQRTGVPGIAVAVVHNDKVVYSHGFGVRSVTTKEPVTPDTVFQLASVSKPLGAAVVAAAVGKGKLKWEDPVRKFLPDFKLSDRYVTRKATVADMYSHRSGLPGLVGNELESYGFSRNTIIKRLRYAPLSPFRISYSYSNFGLTTGGEAAAEAAGTTWEKLADKMIFNPLGMKHTSYRHKDYVARKNRATLHQQSGSGTWITSEREPDAQAPAGGASSTVLDMAKWLRMELATGKFDGKRVLIRRNGDEVTGINRRGLTIALPTPIIEHARRLAGFQCLLDEIQASVDFLRAVQLPQGPVSTKLPRTIRLPEGGYYGASETGTGINGYWIVSKGDVVPWRMKMRTASFNNARALEAALPGTRVEELPLAVTSFMLVTGDMDK